MKASLAYIDDVAHESVERLYANPILSNDEVAQAKRFATKSLAGFPIQDEAAERAHLDAMIAEKRKNLSLYLDGRKKLSETILQLGVTPLAIIPSDLWKALCKQSGLIRLSPSKTGHVSVSTQWTAEFRRRSRFGFGRTDRIVRGWAAEAQKYADKDWPGMIAKLFPNGQQPQHGDRSVRVILPTPPQDVVAILLKAQSMALNVAAVPEAIRFDQSISSIFFSHVIEQVRYEEALRRDPIVYVEQSPATAILAQFGDFPIERELVDRVVAAQLPNVMSEVQKMMTWTA